MGKIYFFFLRGLCVSCCLLFINYSFAQTFTQRYVSITSNTNGFYEYLPADYSSGSATYPLLITLAGTGELGNGVSDLPLMLHNGPPLLISEGKFPSSFTVGGKTFSFIILSPQFEGQAQPSDMDAVIAYAKAHYRVDITRMYLTGLSLGGNTVWNYVSGANGVAAAELAAIVPIAGGEIFESYGPLVIALNNLPVFAAANLNDPTIFSSYTIENVNNINAIVPHINPTALDTIYNASGHEGWTTTYDPTIPMHNGLNIYQWMLQYSRGATSTPLPIKLVSFTADLLSGVPQVQLAWSTSYEQNNHYFLVQRSADGQQFSTIDTTAATDSATGSAYSYTDAHPLAGANYYRLDQVDQDGTGTYSPIRLVNLVAASAELQLSPNPADATVYLEMGGKVSGSLQVRLLDVQGKALRNWVIQKTAGNWNQALDVSGLPAGSYFIQVLGTNYHATKTFIKK
jgi:Secretion system C-terminal sorting domain